MSTMMFDRGKEWAVKKARIEAKEETHIVRGRAKFLGGGGCNRLRR